MNLLPIWLKLAYTAFMAVLFPVYWHYYGPTNFLYACDFALILTLIGIWAESALLVSMCLVGIGAVQALWVVDYLGNLVGVHITGVTDYMFEFSTPVIFARTILLSWLVTVPARVLSVETRLRPTRARRMDWPSRYPAADLLLLHAAPTAGPWFDTR